MPSTRLAITVYGTPAPQGSKRHVGNGVMIEASRGLPTWREDVKQAALQALRDTPEWDPAAERVTLHAAFTFARPKHHFRTGKFAHLLRDGAPNLVATKPDLDKLLRSTGDALAAAGVYRDDCRIVQIFAVKSYPTHVGNPGALDRPGARLVITRA